MPVTSSITVGPGAAQPLAAASLAADATPVPAGQSSYGGVAERSRPPERGRGDLESAETPTPIVYMGVTPNYDEDAGGSRRRLHS
jgi:hypothetical protein